jgi:hypothetical protein
MVETIASPVQKREKEAKQGQKRVILGQKRGKKRGLQLLIRVKIYLTNQTNSVILALSGERYEPIQDVNRSNSIL